MNKDFLEILRCPLTESNLTVAGGEWQGAELEYGVLAGDGGEYPVVSGIPILKHGQSEIVDLIRSGQHRLATACAIAGSKQSELAAAVLSSNAALRRLRRFTRGWERDRRNRWLAKVADAVLPEGGAEPDARALFDFYHRRCGSRSDEVFNYNFYRFGMPGVFVALSFANAVGPRSGFVLDHSCGAGHITWGIRQAVTPAQCVGFDLSFFNLYVARKVIARGAWHVCGEILQLPFRGDAFSAIFSSDAFTNFSAKSSAFREMVRTSTPDANIILTTLRNRNHEHLYPSRPITAAAYRAIAGGFEHRALSDHDTLNRYLDGQGVAAARQPEAHEIEKASTLSLWVSKNGGDFADHGRFETQIVPFEELVVNPIYDHVSNGANGKSYVRRYPSAFYAKEDAAMKHYYPEQFQVSSRVEAALGGNDPAPLADLIRVGAVVGRPYGYVTA